ncbi:MAG: hypothetical protein C0631_07955 [Sedimenticola sp.]|jgi:hypothetical protein|nr:MAG: hypothetical protein C0631_07955 [Sedimenticola sp.]
MHDIDLIPEDYRRGKSQSRRLRGVLIAGILILLANGIGFAVIKYLSQQVETDIRLLEGQRNISNQQHSELNRLQDEHRGLDVQWQLLKGLQGGVSAERILLTVDRALKGDDVWFMNWQFTRAGVMTRLEDEAINSGYFIVVPRSGTGKSEEGLKIETHMTIDGQAVDHSALSEFVSRLIDQPGITNVKVLRTTLREQQEAKLVDFSLAISVFGKAGQG